MKPIMCSPAGLLLGAACIFGIMRTTASPGDLYPRGDAFCFTFYSLSETDAVHALAGGATAIGPFYNDQSQALELAGRLNTKLIYKVEPPSMAGKKFAEIDAPDFVWPSDETISNEVAVIVNPVKTNPHLAMWDIMPEELRTWNAPQLHYFKLVASVIHALDPLQRPVYMYEGNNRQADSMAVSVACEDLCAKGSYVNFVSQGAFIHKRIWARWSMEQELRAIARGNSSAVPWIQLWMFTDPAPADFDLIPAWCRHDAYLGLIMGGKGISIFSAARNRAGFSARGFQAYLDGYLSVAHDLNGPLQLAPVFLSGKTNTATAMTITAGPQQLELVYQTTNSYPPVSYLSTTHAGTNYLFMVNSAEQPVTATFSGLPAANREDLFAGGTSPTPGGTFSITLPPLAVKAFRFGPGQ